MKILYISPENTVGTLTLWKKEHTKRNNQCRTVTFFRSPKGFDEKAIFGVDQFLMRGGTIIIASSPFDVSTGDALSIEESETGLEEWLLHNGISVE